WTWSGAVSTSGYGRFRLGPRHRPAHRVSLEWSLGRQLGASEVACHACDNKLCVRPSHIWAGTQKENIRDAVRKGLVRAMLNPVASMVIRHLRAKGVKTGRLARAYVVSASYIRSAVHSETVAISAR